MGDIEIIGVILGVLLPFIYALKRDICKQISMLWKALDELHPRRERRES